ncbi:MAG: apurinic endonuclease Apn1 [Deltaproteobacteria bacterium]|nr:apurinic endonuclease Apn1 [Deltaproteobacteria bacterium]
MSRKGPPLGAHVSVAGGVHTAPERGKRIGADVVQIFSKQNTRWMGKALEEEDARAFREESERTGVRVVAIHCAYLINLGSANETVRTRSLYALEDEASRAAMLGVPYLVMHPGSCGDDPVEEGISRIAAAIRSFGKLPKGVTLLLENTAGQGNSIGRTMGQLRGLLDAAGNPPDVAVCLDSAHLFESGYDIGSATGWEAFLAEMKEGRILPLVRMWHLNDSKTAAGSRVDRHEHIGEGRIDVSAFRRILTHKGFSTLPMVLETPKDGDDEFAMDLRNLAALRKLIA